MLHVTSHTVPSDRDKAITHSLTFGKHSGLRVGGGTGVETEESLHGERLFGYLSGGGVRKYQLSKS